MTTRMCLHALFTLVLGAASIQAADWPCLRGPANDGFVPVGEAVPATLPSAPKELWRVEVTDSLASPVVGGGKVFHVDNRQGQETLHALDAAGGKELWSVAFDAVMKDQQAAPGPRCSPVVDGDRVYVQSCRGEFQCLSAADGKMIWGVHFVRDFEAVFIGEQGAATGASRHGNAGAPLIDGARIIVNVGGTNGASVVCFDKLTGRAIWKSQNDFAGYAPPVIATVAGVRQVVAFTAEALIGLDADSGVLLWRVPVKTGFGRHITTPVVDDDLVLVSSHQAGLIAVRLRKDGAKFEATPAWTSMECAINMSSFVVVDHFLYGLLVGKKLGCVDVKTGEKKWAQRDALTGPLVKDLASFTVMKDKLLVLTFDGQLLLLAADPSACRVISSVQLCEKTWCSPAYADGRLYFRDAKTLRCVQLIP